jgi:hypothetical protein
MHFISKLSVVIAKTLATLLACIIALYVVLLIINLSDEAPSPAAMSMQNLQNTIKPATKLNADNNGYLFLQQYASAEELQLKEPLSTLLRQCPGADCQATLTKQVNLADLLAQHQTVSDWYQQLHRYSYWYEPVPADAAGVLPSYSHLMAAQKLQLTKAWLAAQQQDTTTAQKLLQQDLQFWRTLLVKNNLLISKMITAAAIKQHFEFAAVMQQQLAPDQWSALMPDSWLQPFSADELSLQQALSGEWAYGNNFVSAFVNPVAADMENMAEYLATVVLAPLFQIQATSNQRAAQLLAAEHNKAIPEQPWYSWFYNPVGKLLNNMGAPSYHHYQQNVVALELLRQQVITAAATYNRE